MSFGSDARERRISIHALREEGDNRTPWTASAALIFLSTPSARRATESFIFESPAFPNFYPRPPRGGRRRPALLDHVVKEISIHALREEGDIRVSNNIDQKLEFLSTPSARRATAKTEKNISTFVSL